MGWNQLGNFLPGSGSVFIKYCGSGYNRSGSLHLLVHRSCSENIRTGCPSWTPPSSRRPAAENLFNSSGKQTQNYLNLKMQQIRTEKIYVMRMSRYESAFLSMVGYVKVYFVCDFWVCFRVFSSFVLSEGLNKVLHFKKSRPILYGKTLYKMGHALLGWQ